MFKIEIINELTGKTAGNNGTMEELNLWIEDSLSKNSYGLPERTLTFENNTDFAIQYPELVSRVISETSEDIYNQVQIYELDGDGNPVLVPVLDENSQPVLDPITNEPLYQSVPVLDIDGNPVYTAVYSHTLYHYAIKADYVVTTTDITAETNIQERITRKQDIGKKHGAVCDEILQLVNGDIEERALSDVQIGQMMTDFNKPLTALEKKMPKTAKKEISKISPDGVLITQELIDDVNYIFNKYNVVE